MKIYTSYYGKLRNLPDTITPISIAAKKPNNLKIKEYKKLAPKWTFFQEWKKNQDNDFYIQHFYDEVLNNLNPSKVLEELTNLSDGKDIALICYEKSGDFCHRYLVSKWLMKYFDIDIQEWSK